MDRVKQILEKQGVDSALAYLCISCGFSPNEAREIVYNLI